MFPISTASFVAYVGITAMLVLAPGLSTALVLRNTAEGGHRAGLITALGIAIGNATWACAASLGLAAVLSRAPGALDGLRLLGGVILIGLGGSCLRRAWQMRRTGDLNGSAPQPSPARSPRSRTVLVEGAVTNLLNPSIPVFYVATVPQFISSGDRFVPAFMLLGFVHVTMALVCHSAYAIVLGRVAAALAARGRAWVPHALTGAALVALAVFSLKGSGRI